MQTRPSPIRVIRGDLFVEAWHEAQLMASPWASSAVFSDQDSDPSLAGHVASCPRRESRVSSACSTPVDITLSMGFRFQPAPQAREAVAMTGSRDVPSVSGEAAEAEHAERVVRAAEETSVRKVRVHMQQLIFSPSPFVSCCVMLPVGSGGHLRSLGCGRLLRRRAVCGRAVSDREERLLLCIQPGEGASRHRHRLVCPALSTESTESARLMVYAGHVQGAHGRVRPSAEHYGGLPVRDGPPPAHSTARGEDPSIPPAAAAAGLVPSMPVGGGGKSPGQAGLQMIRH